MRKCTEAPMVGASFNATVWPRFLSPGAARPCQSGLINIRDPRGIDFLSAAAGGINIAITASWFGTQLMFFHEGSHHRRRPAPGSFIQICFGGGVNSSLITCSEETTLKQNCLENRQKCGIVLCESQQNKSTSSSQADRLKLAPACLSHRFRRFMLLRWDHVTCGS